LQTKLLLMSTLGMENQQQEPLQIAEQAYLLSSFQDLSNRYPKHSYTFTTAKDISYVIYFMEVTSYADILCMDINIFNFGFERVITEVPDKSYDPKIKHTIVKSVLDFIKGTNCIVVFSCEASDNKQHCRMKLFDKWFNEKVLKDDHVYIEKTDTIILGDNDTYYASILVQSNNPQKDELVKILKDEISELSKRN
jgi:hypothetical protein